MASLNVFFSFHYAADYSRVAQIRNLKTARGSQSVCGNDWEVSKIESEDSIREWIHAQMRNRACTVVLIGDGTANRKWINYEILQSWNKGLGVVGLRIHRIEDAKGFTSRGGENPFHYVFANGSRLSEIVKCYEPQGESSEDRFEWIEKNMPLVIEEAIDIRGRH